MGLIEDELAEVKKLCEHVIKGSRLVSCVKTMVRVEIAESDFKKIVICIQFPEDYPNKILLIELKSKTLSDKLLDGLTSICEKEATKCIGKPQVMTILHFVKNFLFENPLSCCYNEISNVKELLNLKQDEIKLKQKQSVIILKTVNENYYLNTKIFIPSDYPITCVKIEDIDTNFPSAFFRHIAAQAQEIARKCVEPPLKKPNSKEPPFKPAPSFQAIASFLIHCIKKLPKEHCHYCKMQCFPNDTSKLICDENSPRHVERVYCGHLYHLECLMTYMKAPPFGNKVCPTCGIKISHHKWKLTDKLAEDRWSHEQARERELAEVEDFFK